MLKMQHGLLHAKAINASHVMFVDADDCVSQHLAQFVAQNPNENGWFLGRGFDYQENFRLLRVRHRNLHLRTNTSHVIKLDLLEPEMKLHPDEVKRGDCVLYHIDTAAILKQRGTPLKLLPFRGVIYITDNGENMWWSQQNIASKNNGIQSILAALKSSYQSFITQPVTDSIRDEFGLYPIDAS